MRGTGPGSQELLATAVLRLARAVSPVCPRGAPPTFFFFFFFERLPLRRRFRVPRDARGAVAGWGGEGLLAATNSY